MDVFCKKILKEVNCSLTAPILHLRFTQEDSLTNQQAGSMMGKPLLCSVLSGCTFSFLRTVLTVHLLTLKSILCHYTKQ